MLGYMLNCLISVSFKLYTLMYYIKWLPEIHECYFIYMYQLILNSSNTFWIAVVVSTLLLHGNTKRENPVLNTLIRVNDMGHLQVRPQCLLHQLSKVFDVVISCSMRNVEPRIGSQCIG